MVAAARSPHRVHMQPPGGERSESGPGADPTRSRTQARCLARSRAAASRASEPDAHWAAVQPRSTGSHGPAAGHHDAPSIAGGATTSWQASLSTVAVHRPPTPSQAASGTRILVSTPGLPAAAFGLAFKARMEKRESAAALPRQLSSGCNLNRTYNKPPRLFCSHVQDFFRSP